MSDEDGGVKSVACGSGESASRDDAGLASLNSSIMDAAESEEGILTGGGGRFRRESIYRGLQRTKDKRLKRTNQKNTKQAVVFPLPS